MRFEEYCVRLMDLPCGVKALVQYDAEGFPNIYVNARLTQEEQRRAVEHEIRHIERDDAYNDLTIEEVEG